MHAEWCNHSSFCHADRKGATRCWQAVVVLSRRVMLAGQCHSLAADHCDALFSRGWMIIRVVMRSVFPLSECWRLVQRAGSGLFDTTRGLMRWAPPIGLKGQPCGNGKGVVGSTPPFPASQPDPGSSPTPFQFSDIRGVSDP